MATLFRRASGWTIQFVTGERRRTIAIGNQSPQVRNRILDNIEAIVSCHRWGIDLPAYLVDWFGALDSKVQRAVLNSGIIVRNQIAGKTVQMIADHYFEIGQWKASTIESKKQTTKALVKFFGDRSIDTITPGCADEFRAWLIKSAGLARTTASKRCVVAKHIFNAAVAKRWVAENPFKDMRHLTTSNSSRLHMVPNSLSKQIVGSFDLIAPTSLAAVEMAALFACYRWGGLRGEEPRSMLWEWIDFKNGTMTVFSPKNEMHDNAFRTLPLFPEVRERLTELWLNTSGESEFMFDLFRKHCRGWFTTRLNALLKVMKIDPWPRLIQNLRASRATEIMKKCGPKYESVWLGHSAKVSMESYQMLEETISSSVCNWTTDE